MQLFLIKVYFYKIIVEYFDVTVDQLTQNIMNMSTNCAPSTKSANDPNDSVGV